MMGREIIGETVKKGDGESSGHVFHLPRCCTYLGQIAAYVLNSDLPYIFETHCFMRLVQNFEISGTFFLQIRMLSDANLAQG